MTTQVSSFEEKRIRSFVSRVHYALSDQGSTALCSCANWKRERKMSLPTSTDLSTGIVPFFCS